VFWVTLSHALGKLFCCYYGWPAGQVPAFPGSLHALQYRFADHHFPGRSPRLVGAIDPTPGWWAQLTLQTEHALKTLTCLQSAEVLQHTASCSNHPGTERIGGDSPGTCMTCRRRTYNQSSSRCGLTASCILGTILRAGRDAARSLSAWCERHKQSFHHCQSRRAYLQCTAAPARSPLELGAASCSQQI
jgi:hypothetical protein